MKLFRFIILTSLIFSSLLAEENNYISFFTKPTTQQAGILKMCIGSLLMLYGAAHFGISVPFFEPIYHHRFSQIFKGGIYAGSGFALLESGFSNFNGEKNFMNEPRSLTKHWDDHLKKACKYSVLIAGVPMIRYLN